MPFINFFKYLYDRYKHSRPEQSFMLFQAVLAVVFIAPLGIWRFSIGDTLQGLFDIVVCALFLILAYFSTKDRYFVVASRTFAVVYTIAVWIVVQFIGVVGLYWSYATSVAVFFAARRSDAVIIAILTYSACVFSVWQQAETQVIFTYTACFALIILYCFNFSSRLTADNRELAKQANKDALTGLGNRRLFDDSIDAIMRAAVNECHFSLIMFDVDHFKLVNDTHGHEVGDLVLARLAKLVANYVGGRGEVYRYGGEEFMIILPSELDEAVAIAEKIREVVVNTSILRAGEDGLTISLGVAPCEAGGNGRSWLKKVDDALYQAKTTGRNRVCIAS